MQTKTLTVREINKLTRDGGNGLNVYFYSERITRAKTVKGEMRVLTISGAWYIVRATDTFTVSL